MPVKHTTSTCVIATALLIGCSSNGNDDSNPAAPETAAPDASGQNSMPAPGVDPSSTPQSVSRYNGSYFRDCINSEDDEEVWDTVEIMIQNDTASSIITEYSDAQCTLPTFVIALDISLEYPGGTADTSLGVADFLNSTIESATVNGQMSSGDNEVDFGLILLDGNTLYFGLSSEELSGETLETRPVQIDQSNQFIRR